MYRTQLQLTEEQARALKELAANQNRSMAEIVREAVDVLLRTSGPVDVQERKRRAIAAAGRFHSGQRDISLDHDRYLGEAYQDADPR